MKCGALFSGIGGFCLGFEKAGMPSAWAVERDPYAMQTYHYNLPSVRCVQKDIRSVTAKDDLEPVDVLHAGFPCQSFSQAGKRTGFDDPRGQVFFEIIRLIEEFKDKKPKILVFENVPYLRHGNGGQWYHDIQTSIKNAGYWFSEDNACELNAYDLTVLPQQRRRLFMVALSKAHFSSGAFDFPAVQETAPKQLEQYIDFEGVVDDSYYLTDHSHYYPLLSNAVTQRTCLYQVRFSKVRIKKPGICPTLMANTSSVPFIMSTKGIRKLTEYECLRLQGFPQGFSFPDPVPRYRRYQQVGNAVVVPLITLLAEKIKHLAASLWAEVASPA